MALITQGPKGTQDLMPKDTAKWQIVEEVMKGEASLHGFHEVRTPVFEHTELFLRGVGDTTDVVEKQMYTFEDKGQRSITLRPEGTAGVVRAMLQSGIYNEGYPVKLCYFTSCYRYEKPQAGRLREFHQFGIECFGAASPLADAEVIALANSYFAYLGLENFVLEINSIGCPECRKKYSEALKAYFADRQGDLCETCLSRLERNPMRILDCKSPVCSKIAEGAPVVLDFICDDCREHFESLKKYLDASGIEYTVNPQIVRGLDYYTRTVFEFVSKDEKTNGLVLCGGGRYDGLVEELGGAALPACGLAIGLERLLLAMEESGVAFPEPPQCNLSIVTAGERAVLKALEISADLRAEGYSVNIDTVGRSIKAQMKYANKINSQYTVVIGDNEIESDSAKLKSMDDGTETEVKLSSFCEGFERAFMDKAVADFGNVDFSSLTQIDINNLLK